MCRFCQIIQENVKQVYRDELISVFLDIDPISNGHVLIMPNGHYLDIDEMPFATLTRIMLVARQIVGIYKEQLHPPGYSMMQNGGQFNDIGHFHLHVFPRYDEKHFHFSYQDSAVALGRKRQEMQELLQKCLSPEPSPKKPFPILTTERLLLNQLQLSDVETVTQLAGNENVSRSTLNIPYPYASADAYNWIQACGRGYQLGEQCTFAVRDKNSLALLGAVGLVLSPRHRRATMGYWMGEPYWSRGYTSEAVSALLAFGFRELDLNKIDATHLLDNPASGKVMTKNGMISEGVLPEHFLKGDTLVSVRQYRLLRREWEALS